MPQLWLLSLRAELSADPASGNKGGEKTIAYEFFLLCAFGPLCEIFLVSEDVGITPRGCGPGPLQSEDLHK